MARKQRGATAHGSSKTADNGDGGHAEHFSLLLESSDDEAPEEVTFEDSKTQALRSMKDALDTVRREKEQLKEKRRRRQELFQEQKKRRLLPADVLEEIDSSSFAKKQKPSDDKAEEQQQEEDDEEEEERGKTQKKRSGKLAHARNLKGNYTVATVKERSSATFQQQVAQDFIQSRLYGPGSCRTTNNELLSLQNKKGRNQSAAVQFVKKDWASKERAKAEKMKKRWIHKQQVHSC
ncbi:putative nucleolar protein 7 isoform 2 [Scophthalmus maximus]|uniref:Putative nucleolar protein 7 n=1 Tax=Scophthalmus maximus TaxID=52904 RepID=A0A2U9BIA8_SCOMX|nr:nucleolar protein 7 [Scophthalmus maximus]AWP03569.1 putative nucleolar protein 7 [Scophthalmus maximus]AWP03570.1 putative nucleolar protein 7 isoform 2 [Scophthalmus maximus]